LLGLHPSTISRAVAEKFVETPKGVLKLKSLFPKEVNPALSSDKIKEIISQILKNEEKEYPLTDPQIKKALREFDIDIDRRTVADYRKELGIEPAKKRGPNSA
jgi:RNA polymerase sigma-54 factor